MIKRGLQKNHSLLKVVSVNEKTRFSERSGSSLYNRSHSRWMKVSIVSGKYRAHQACLRKLPNNSIMSARVSVCPHTSVYSYLSLLSLFPCHCPTCSIVLFMSCISASRSLSLLSAWLFSCLSALSLCLSTLTHQNMSVLLNKCPVVLYEVTLPGSVSSPSVSQLAWNHLNGFEIASK